MKLALLSSLNALYAGRYLKIKQFSMGKILDNPYGMIYQHRNDAGVKRKA
jgi:hypothetical protein